METETLPPTDEQTVDQIIHGYDQIKTELRKTIVGQQEVIALLQELPALPKPCW